MVSFLHAEETGIMKEQECMPNGKEGNGRVCKWGENKWAMILKLGYSDLVQEIKIR